MGSMKINATPEGANFDFSGGELDVTLHPAHTVVKPVYYFHRTEQNVRNYYPMLRHMPLEQEEVGRPDARVLNYEKTEGSGEDTPSLSRAQHEDDEYTGGGGTREFFEPHVDKNSYHNRYLAIHDGDGGKEWYDSPSTTHGGSARTVPETLGVRENPSWIEEGRRRKAPISFFHRFGPVLNERKAEEAVGEHISPPKYEDADTDAGSTIASIELQRPPEGDIDDFTKKVYPVDMGSGSAAVQSPSALKEGVRNPQHKRKHHRRHHHYRLPSIIIVKEESPTKENGANEGKGTSETKTTSNEGSHGERRIKADVNGDENSDTRSANTHGTSTLNMYGNDNYRADDNRGSDLEEARVREDIRRIRNRLSHSDKEANESYRDGDDGDDDGEEDNVNGLVIDILGDADQDVPKYRRKNRENLREFHRGRNREDSNGMDDYHNSPDNKGERDLPAGSHFEADDIHRYYNREAGSRDRLNDDNDGDYGNIKSREDSSREQVDAARKAYLPHILEGNANKKDSVESNTKSKTHVGMPAERRHTNLDRNTKTTKHQIHFLMGDQSTNSVMKHAINSSAYDDYRHVNNQSPTKSFLLSSQNNKAIKARAKVLSNSVKYKKNVLRSDKINNKRIKSMDSLISLHERTKRQSRPSYLERLVSVLRRREVEQSFHNTTIDGSGP